MSPFRFLGVPCKSIELTYWGRERWDYWDTTLEEHIWSPFFITGTYELFGTQNKTRDLFFEHSDERRYLVWTEVNAENISNAKIWAVGK